MPKIKFDKNWLEVLLLLLFVGILFFVNIAQSGGYEISHTHPVGYGATDCFYTLTVCNYVKDVGNYANQPSYMAAGFEDTIGYLPPLIHHLTAIFSNISGMEIHDSLSFLVVTFFTLIALVMYLTIRDLNPNMAILSLPFMLGVYHHTFTIPIAWGHWMLIVGSLFLACSIWTMTRLKDKYSFLLLAIFLTGAALGHTSELIFAIGFLAFYLLVTYLTKGLKTETLTKVGYGLLISLILSAYYLIIFRYTWMVSMPYKFGISLDVGTGFPIVKFSYFSFVAPLIVAGIIVSFLQKKKYSAAVLGGIYILLIGYTNYIGFGMRAFQTRELWPIYLAVFPGMFLYFLAKKGLKKWDTNYSIAAAMLLLLLFTGFHLDKRSTGLMNEFDWDGLQWVDENVPKDSQVLFWYGAITSQDAALHSAKMATFSVDQQSMISAIQKGEIKRIYNLRLAMLPDTRLPYRKGLFDFGYHFTEEDIKRQTDLDICTMDYIYFNKAGMAPVLIQYGLAVREHLLTKEWFEEIYSNEHVSIIKNGRPGDVCIG
ncbi:hypothetical protein ACFLQI_01350 [Candidatus Undinarchaeota archaeon]